MEINETADDIGNNVITKNTGANYNHEQSIAIREFKKNIATSWISLYDLMQYECPDDFLSALKDANDLIDGTFVRRLVALETKFKDGKIDRHEWDILNNIYDVIKESILETMNLVIDIEDIDNTEV